MQSDEPLAVLPVAADVGQRSGIVVLQEVLLIPRFPYAGSLKRRVVLVMVRGGSPQDLRLPDAVGVQRGDDGLPEIPLFGFFVAAV